MIQVTRDVDESLSAFFGGKTQAPFAYGDGVDVMLGGFDGADVRVRSPNPDGYDALTEFSNLEDSVTCKLASGLCAVTPCPGGQVLDGVCTLANNTYCRDYEISAATTAVVGGLTPQGAGAFVVSGVNASQGAAGAGSAGGDEEGWLSSAGAGSGVVLEVPSPVDSATSDGSGQFSFGFSAGLAPGESGTVEVSLDQGDGDGSGSGSGAGSASLSSSVTYSRARLAASNVTAQVLTSEVWPDSRTVYVAVQVRDERGSTRTASTQVHVRLVGGASLQQVDTSTPSGSCSADQATGACIASVVVPEAWVSSAGAVSASQDSGGDDGTGVLEVDVEYGLAASFQGAAVLSGAVGVRPESAFDASGSNGLVVARLPQRSLRSGDEFEVPLSAQALRAINTFRVSVFVGGDLEIVRFEVDEDKWTGTYAVTSDGRNATGSYILSNPKTAPQDEQTEEQELSRVVLRVRQGVASSDVSTPLVQVHALYLSDIDRRPLVASDAGEPASVIVRRGGAHGGADGVEENGRGFVVVEPEEIVGLIASAERSELVNTAVVSGVEETSVLRVQAVSSWAPGTLANVGSGTSGLECTSLDTDVLGADSSCAAVRLAGDELGGSDAARVSVRYAGHEQFVPFRVWYPEEPVSVVLDRDVVRRVARWHRDAGHDESEGCVSLATSQFQRARVSVLGRFRSGGEVSGQVSLDGLVASTQYSVSNTSVARMDDVVSGHVQGVGAGDARVVVRSAAVSGSRELGSANMTAVDSYVGVVGLDVVVVSGLAVSSETTSLSGAGDSGVASVVVERDVLTFEGERASVFVSAVFEDLTRMALGVGREVRLRSLARGVLRVDGGEPGAVYVPVRAEDGRGALVEAVWTAGSAGAGCGELEVVRGTGYAEVKLPPAQSASVAVSENRVTFEGDAAATSGVATAAELTIRLHYEGRVVDATLDNRTVIDLSGARDLVVLEEGGSTGLRLVANPAKAGQLDAESVAEVRVSFVHENVTAIASVSVAEAVGVRAGANPYPRYSGSDGVFVNTMARLAGTEPAQYQELVVRGFLELSDGDEIDVTREDALSVAEEGAVVVEDGGAVGGVSGGDAVSLVRSSGRFRVQLSDSGSDALNETNASGRLVVTLRLSYDGSATSAGQDLVVNVTREAVLVAQLEGFGAASGSTLRGFVGDETTVDMRAVLDDGRVLPTLFTGGQPLLPGLIVFSSSDESGATVDARLGTVRLEGNAALEVVVTALVDDGRSGADAVSATTSIACNLDPEVGDVDVGLASGVAVGPVTVGDEVTVPVRVNSGGLAVGAYEFAVMFDTEVLEFVSAEASHSGLFDRNAQTAGEVVFGGTVSGDSLSGSELELAELVFRVVGSGSSVLSGTVVTLSQPDVSGTAIGSGQARAFVAGRVPFVAEPNDRRRRRRGLSSSSSSSAGAAGAQSMGPVDAAVEAHVARQRRSSDRAQRGDTNGDGMFTVSDVRFVLTYLVEEQLQFATARGQQILALHVSKPYTFEELDADLNTERNEDDASYLNKVNFGLLRFVSVPSVRGVGPGTGCELEISVVLFEKGGGAASGTNTRVYFDVEGGSVPAGEVSGESSVGAELSTSSSVFSAGEFVTSSKGGASLSGAIVEAAVVNASAGLWRVSVPVSTVREDIGLSVIQVTDDPSGPDVFFTIGPSSTSPVFNDGVLASLVAFGSNLTVFTPTFGGFNPLTFFDNLEDSVMCKVLSGTCDDLPCGPSSFLNGTCTLFSESHCTSTVSIWICLFAFALLRCYVCFVSLLGLSVCSLYSSPCRCYMFSAVSDCTVCAEGFFAAVPCNATSDTVCEPVLLQPSSSNDNVAAIAGGAAGGVLLVLLVLVLLYRRRKESPVTVDPEAPKDARQFWFDFEEAVVRPRDDTGCVPVACMPLCAGVIFFFFDF